MNVDKVQPSFGMAFISKDVKSVDSFMFKHFSPKDSMTYRLLERASRDCDVDVYLSVVNNNGKEHLKAEVGPKEFISGFFKSPIKILKKANKYAFSLHNANIKA